MIFYFPSKFSTFVYQPHRKADIQRWVMEEEGREYRKLLQTLHAYFNGYLCCNIPLNLFLYPA